MRAQSVTGKATALRAVALTWTLFPRRERPGRAAQAQPLPGGVPEGFPPAARPGAAVVSSPRVLQPGNPGRRDAWDGYSGTADYGLKRNLLANRF